MKKTIHNLIIHSLCLTILMVVSACVGKVESNKREEVKSPIENNETVTYDGVVEALAISHEAIEVVFAPLPNGVDDAIVYIHLNNSPKPIQVVAADIETRADGNFMYSVYNLKPGTIYSVRVNLFDKKKSKLIQSKNQLTVRTFTQRVATFKGIKAVENFIGTDSMSKLRLIYDPAYNDSKITVKDYHNKRYIIRYTWGDSAEKDILDFDSAPNKNTVYQDHYSGSTANDSYDAIGLLAGTKYCFNITSEHREHYYKDPQEVVPLEANTRYECATTVQTVGPMEWDATSVNFTLGLGPDARDTIQVSWDAAEGAFAGYMLLIAGVEIGTAIKITPGTANQFTDASMDALIPGNITHVKQVENSSGAWDPNLRNFSISGLDSYSYYQARLVVCRNATCQDSDRIESPMQVLRTIPALPTNGGVDVIHDPWDKTAPTRGKVEFPPLDVNSGYADFLHLYCFSDDTGANPIKLDYSIEVNSPGHPCHGLTRQTNHPASFGDYATFTEIEFTDSQGVDGNRYCFGVIPQVVDADYTTDDSAYPVKVVCKTLRLLTPTLEQFSGVTSGCNSTKINEDRLSVDWEDPSGGLYTKYEVYMVNKKDQNFSYANAIAGDADYTVVDNIADGTNTYEYTDLIPGDIYQIGVLAYLDDGSGGKIYSEYNNGILECRIPYPEATFGMFQDIMAVGPKTHGLHPEHYLDALYGGDDRMKRKHLLETIDPITHLPAEVELDVDEVTPANPGAHSAINGANQFSGIYGRKDNDGANAVHAYSNQGIVRLVWEDFRIGITSKADPTRCESERVDGKMNLYEAACVYGVKATEEGDKNNRKFGYKVYRSYNNKSTWKELTVYDGTTPQTAINQGLIRAEEYHYWGWNSLPGSARAQQRTKIYAGSFIDYSVLYQPDDYSEPDPIGRGLIVYYKVVPVFNGIEIAFDDSDNKNVVRVIVPPANMAFVHRKMANKAMCDQLAMPIDTSPTMHYSCAYNGLGARPVVNYSSGQGRYDIGTDLLVDRYELGCKFTRGSTSEAESTIHNDFITSSDDLRAYEFEGTSQSGNFIGCNTSNRNMGRGDSSLAWESNVTATYDYMLKGDCVGEGSMEGVYPATCPAGSDDTAGARSYKIPGLSQAMDCASASNDADDPQTLDNDVINYYMQPAQPHAVYFYRDTSGNSFSLPAIAGRNGSNLSVGAHGVGGGCMINLPYVHDFGEGDRFVPRWFSLSDIMVFNVGGSNMRTSTLREIYNDRTALYDDVGDPTPFEVFSPLDSAANDIISGELRYNYYLDRSLLRYITSNESQLPPITGMSQYSAATMCDSYEVEIGTQNSGGAYVVEPGSRQNKGLPSKKLQLAFSQWPDTFRPPFGELNVNDMGHMERIVDGTELTSPEYDGEVAHGENISCNVSGKNIASQNYSTGDLIRSTLASENGSTVLTGSTIQRAPAGNSTEGCMSRFGVQDFVGNVEEPESGRYDCDTSEEELLFGPIAGPGRYNNSVFLAGDGTDPVISDHPLHAGMDWWVQSGNNTGQCSAYADGSVRTGVPFTIGGDINPAVKFDGSLNTDLITNAYTQLDNWAIEDMRDGFGVIWDTGQTAHSPAIAADNTLSLSLTTNKYFSPAVGVPLNTGIENVIDYNGGNVNPSQMWFQIGIDKFFTNNPGIDEDDFWIPYFPTGQSEMTSVGMSTVYEGTATYDDDRVGQNDFTILYDVTPHPTSPSPQWNTRHTIMALAWGAGGGGDLSGAEPRWNLSRDRPTTFYSGGNYATTTPGRYSSRFLSYLSGGTGTRCMVRVPSN